MRLSHILPVAILTGLLASALTADEGGGSDGDGVDIVPMSGAGYDLTVRLGAPYEDPLTGATMRDGTVVGHIFRPWGGLSWDGVPIEPVSFSTPAGSLVMDCGLIPQIELGIPEPDCGWPTIDIDGDQSEYNDGNPTNNRIGTVEGGQGPCMGRGRAPVKV